MFHQVTGSSNDIVPQTEYEKKYDTQQFVGRGNFSIVHLAIQKETGKKFAVKIIDKTKFMFQSKVLAALDREVEILAKVQPHVNIVGFEEAFDEGDKLRIVMELLPGGDLLKLLKTRGPLDEETVRGFFLQMVHVLKYLKTKGITHRDLKPDNFLVADGDVLKLADFGIAKGTSAGNALNTMCGTPAYLAPEVILGKPYDSRVDVYSIGVILFFLLSCGDTPYQNAQSEPELYQKVKNGDVDWSAPSWATVSPSAKDLIRQLMALDPAQRIKLEDIEAHAWFNRVYAHLVLQGEKQDIFELKSVITKIGRSGSEYRNGYLD
ncbi:kinase-like protein [Rhizoclosmatium globosum]|uniref:Kinase-like protein n=1 Tax=Rhizoclosmatium globosum TaxID=329046 RepID=A0A1Y2CKD6_9FUNG|nr:kinase-like protein [Rhizoclosmatium globosum]|eukprot:ORY47427.1 kinase-like protein [Rhizoclosmatium globosum]